MNQIPDSAKVLTVSNINHYIKALLASDFHLSGIYVSGEISNFKVYRSGHAYFSLKDAGGLLKCVMFASRVSAMQFMPKDGMRVLVYGSVSVYERDGVYQLYAERMLPDGVGSLYMAYEALKEKLTAEGLFDESVKRRIPFLPSCVGVVTSESGAVIRDIQTVINRRFPTMNLKLFHVSVQGENASPEIVRALSYISKTRCCDVVIVGRGGGSIEDLWAFNEEQTVRAVAACAVPVISAVGHETDYTLTDFAADLRAPTPSAAAELAVPVLSELRSALMRDQTKIASLPLTNCKIKQAELDRLKNSRFFTKPLELTAGYALSLDHDEERLCSLMYQQWKQCQSVTEAQLRHLDALNPSAVLQRGYSIVYNKEGKAVTTEKAVKNGEFVEICTGDGRFSAMRIKTEE